MQAALLLDDAVDQGFHRGGIVHIEIGTRQPG